MFTFVQKQLKAKNKNSISKYKTSVRICLRLKLTFRAHFRNTFMSVIQK